MDKYHWVRFYASLLCYEGLNGEFFTAYDAFMRLMKLLEESGSPFWGNRTFLLINLRNLCIMISKETLEIHGFFLMQEQWDVISVIQSFKPRNGYGTLMIEYIKDNSPHILQVNEMLSESVGFWKKMNIHTVSTNAETAD